MKIGVSVDETVKRLPDLLMQVQRLTNLAAVVDPQKAEQIESEITLIVEELIENGIN